MIYEDALLVSKKTGEVIGDYSNDVLFVQTKEQREQARKHAEAESGKEKGEVKFTPESKYEHMGGFIWNIHDGAQTLYPEIRPASLTRLMYLSTFLCYDGYLKDGRNAITKNMLILYLGVSKREYYRFWDEMSSSGLMCEADGKVYLNEDMFVKGSIKKDKIRDLSVQGKYITRIYIKAVRELYLTSTGQSVKTLSYLFRIMPYVNKEYNICCFNPLEEDLDQIQTMTLGDFADVVGYDRSKVDRLAKVLQRPTFEVGNKQKNAMRYVAAKDTTAEAYGMFINPRVYYAGSDWSKVEVLCAF